MIMELVKRWEEKKSLLQKHYSENHPEDYKSIVSKLIELITNDEYEELALDPERIHQIDDGDYQGTLLYVIAEKAYQPSIYYYVKVSYGSCSGCDTLERIKDYDTDNKPTEKQTEGYMTLSLHVLQQIKKMEELHYFHYEKD